MIMEPRAGEPNEVEGVLNPAAIRGRDGQLYLFPRLVARGNYSRIGLTRVLFDVNGDPKDIERMGIALEPEADYELTETGGGCEDPRITYLEPLQHYVMTYTALSRNGPRIAVAVSDDLFTWRRLGLAKFHPYHHIAFDDVDDKDASVSRVDPRSVGQGGGRAYSPAVVSRNAAGRKSARRLVRGCGSGMYLDLILPRG